MGDIPYIQQAQEVKITGQDSGGTTVNYVGADTNGNLQVGLNAVGGSTITLGQKSEANSFPMVTASDQLDKVVTGSITNSGTNQQVVINTVGMGTVTVTIGGSWTSGSGVVFETTYDSTAVLGSTDWSPIFGIDVVLLDGQIYTSVQKNTIYKFDVSGTNQFRVFSGSGNNPNATMTIAIEASPNVGVISGILNGIFVQGGNITLASGTNKIGVVGTAQASSTSGQFGQLVQGAVTTSAPTYVTGQIDPLSLTTAGALRVDGSGVTQPVSGTVTANAGTGNFTVVQATASNLNATIVGTKTNNNAAPGANNFGVLPALANAAAPSWSEGDQVLLSEDLAGNTRVIDIADGPVTAGTAATKSNLTGGQFNTALPALTNTQQVATQMDASGRTIVTNVPLLGIAKTYSAAGLVTAAASATDIFTIIGSATKTVVITNIVISGIATAATVANVFIVKRSAADTSGTPTTLTNVPNDSADAAATAVCTTYAGVPATGATVGNMRVFKVYLPPPSGGSANSPSFPIFSPATVTQSIVLRGIAETLAINLNGVTIAGAIFAISVEWIEF